MPEQDAARRGAGCSTPLHQEQYTGWPDGWQSADLHIRVVPSAKRKCYRALIATQNFLAE
jgi:hypothetical protein